MAKRSSQRLGIGGEMVPPGANFQAQWLFLEAVRRCVPEALWALAKIAPSLPDDYFNRDNRDQEQPLRSWCEDWGFTTDWLLAVARHTATLTPPPSCETSRTRVVSWNGYSRSAAGRRRESSRSVSET